MDDRFKLRIWDKRKNNYLKDFVFNFINKAPYVTIEYFDNEYAYTHTFEENEIVIEQCTGLKDKNGKLIYEGDILKCIHSDIMKYKIYWERNCWGMKVYGTNNEIVDDVRLFLDTNIFEVIGNIHKNADLLENKE